MGAYGNNYKDKVGLLLVAGIEKLCKNLINLPVEN